MLAQPRCLEAGERGDRPERGVDPLACDPDLRERLGCDRLLPHPRLVQLGEKLVEVLQRDAGEPGLVGSARSTLDDGPGLVGPRRREKEGDIPRHVQQPHRQRDLVAAGVGEALSVPTSEDELEALLDAGAEVEPPGESLRDLAHRRERGTGPRAGVRDGVLDQRLSDLRAATGADVGAIERQDLGGVGRVDEEERGPMRDVVAVQLRRLVAVRRASGGVEERDVVRVGELLRRHTGELAETDGEEGAAQGMLERLSGAEVGGEREGSDDLGRADRLLARRWCCRDRTWFRRHTGILGGEHPPRGSPRPRRSRSCRRRPPASARMDG